MAIVDKPNLLVDGLPYEVDVGGVPYPIQTDFRAGIELELVLQDDEIADEEKVQYALLLYFGENHPHDAEAAIDAILWFYRCGESPPKPKRKKETEAEETEKQEAPENVVFSYEHDAPYVYAAFLAQYGIDLVEIKHLHWWKYRALFQAIRDEELIKKVIAYRSVDLSKIKDKSEKSRLARLKAIYALPNDKKIAEQKSLDQLVFGKAREAKALEENQ